MYLYDTYIVVVVVDVVAAELVVQKVSADIFN
jgi:hypothetical protein